MKWLVFIGVTFVLLFSLPGLCDDEVTYSIDLPVYFPALEPDDISNFCESGTWSDFYFDGGFTSELCQVDFRIYRNGRGFLRESFAADERKRIFAEAGSIEEQNCKYHVYDVALANGLPEGDYAVYYEFELNNSDIKQIICDLYTTLFPVKEVEDCSGHGLCIVLNLYLDGKATELSGYQYAPGYENDVIEANVELRTWIEGFLFPFLKDKGWEIDIDEYFELFNIMEKANAPTSEFIVGYNQKGEIVE